jgi:predicted ATPase
VVPVDALIERDLELGVLGDAVEAAASGRGGAVLTEGGAGIGKTRLLRMARGRAEAAGVRVPFAAADDFESNVPLAAARELLAAAARGVARAGRRA